MGCGSSAYKDGTSVHKQGYQPVEVSEKVKQVHPFGMVLRRKPPMFADSPHFKTYAEDPPLSESEVVPMSPYVP